jgi:hypothetical protein
MIECKCINKATKCSENGIYSYCVDCGKIFEWKEDNNQISEGKE